MFEPSYGPSDRRVRNNALTEALEYFYTLATNSTGACRSGMAKLYCFQSNGADMTGVIPPDGNPFVAPDTDFTPSETLRNSLASKSYGAFAITSNIKAWIDVMCGLLVGRVQDSMWINHRRVTTLGDGEGDADAQRYAAFPPSPAIMDRINNIIERTAQPVSAHNANLVEQDLWLAIEALRITSDTELHGIIGNDGRGHVYPENLPTLQAWVDWVRMFMTTVTTDYKRLLLPVYRITLNLLRLYYAEVAHLGDAPQINTLTASMKNLQISNDTLISIPAPTPALAVYFADNDCPAISQIGLLYLDRVNDAFTSRRYL